MRLTIPLRIRPLLLVCGFLLSCVSASAQGLLNSPSFERRISGWRLSAAAGALPNPQVPYAQRHRTAEAIEGLER